MNNKYNYAIAKCLREEYPFNNDIMEEEKEFRCANCSEIFKMKFDNNLAPISLWCDKCRATQNKIKQKFKMENSSKNPRNKDPYVALAQMKVLLDRAKPYWLGIDNKHNPLLGKGHDAKSIILSEIDDILKKAKIPSKYLIAESLD